MNHKLKWSIKNPNKLTLEGGSVYYTKNRETDNSRDNSKKPILRP